MDRLRKRKRQRARNEDQSLSSSAMENLPSLILMDIISRLPIKTVMAVRCVCKSLLDLVSDSYFAKLHSARAPTEFLLRNHLHEEVSLSTTLYIAEPVEVDSSTVVDIKMNSVFDLPRFSVRPKNDLNLRASKTSLTLVNTCNGLVCFRGPHTNRFAVICNPFTGEYVTIPGPDRKDNTIEMASTSYGLGFGLKGDRFKLMRVLVRKNAYIEHAAETGEERTRIVGGIYTFGESGSSWKSVADCPNVYLSENPTFYKGVLHWFSHSSGDIVTYDFDNEQFGQINPPHFWDEKMEYTAVTSLGVLGDCLYRTASSGDCVDVWVMKEYGVQSSWIKAFSIQKGADDVLPVYKPIQCMQNGEILICKHATDMVCYNPDTTTVKFIGSFFLCCEAISIKPSLVSLKVMLGDNMKAHNAKSRRAHKKCREVAEVLPWWTSSISKVMRLEEDWRQHGQELSYVWKFKHVRNPRMPS